MIVRKYCPQCSALYYAGHPNVGVGQPVQVCQSCHGFIVDKSDNEWELMSVWARAYRWFAVCWTAALLGGFGSFVLLALVADHFQVTDILRGPLSIVIVSVGTPALGFFGSKQLRADIEQSRLRMRDQRYVEFLRRFGLTN